MAAKFKVDEMGNCWAIDDTERLRPVRGHVELDADRARCPCAEAYVFRKQTQDDKFEWRCACGKVFPNLHH
jgi:hypothetical protein